MVKDHALSSGLTILHKYLPFSTVSLTEPSPSMFIHLQLKLIHGPTYKDSQSEFCLTNYS